MMPNKTIYVSDGDLPIFERAQEMAGGNLSSAIASALRRYVETEETHEGGEVVVKVGEQGAYVQKRFQGRLVGKFSDVSADHSRMHSYRVYLTPKGNLAVHVKEMPNWANMSRRDWHRTWNAREMYDGEWWHSTNRLEIFPSLDELRGHVPEQLFTVVAAMVQHDGIEDLDI